MIPKIVSRERLCSLCGGEGTLRGADYRVESPLSAVGVLSCSVHLGESVSLVMTSRRAIRVTVTDLDAEEQE